uniref:Uncharacterized protein n=1 Tax=Cannabis sativa TaxID=3483 RepID=A0A803QE77_CANSA
MEFLRRRRNTHHTDILQCLQYWAYEAILELSNAYAVRMLHRFPKIVNWENKENTIIVDSVLFVMSPVNEEELVRTIIGGEGPLFVDLEELLLGDDGQQTQDALRNQAQKLTSTLEEETDAALIFRDSTPPAPSPPPEDPHIAPSASIPNTSKAREPVYFAILARLETIEREQIALRQGQTTLLKGQTKIMGYLKTLMGLIEDQRRPNSEVEPQQELQSLENEIIYLNDYRLDDPDDVLCEPDHMKITSIRYTQDFEIQILETTLEPVENRRKRKQRRWFDECTKMKKKSKASKKNVNADPLRVVDRKLLSSIQSWVLSQIGNKYPSEC